MKYMLVQWNKQTLQWTIIHYSNTFTDVFRHYGLHSKDKNVKLMFNIDELKEAGVKLMAKEIWDKRHVSN